MCRVTHLGKDVHPVPVYDPACGSPHAWLLSAHAPLHGEDLAVAEEIRQDGVHEAVLPRAQRPSTCGDEMQGI